VQLPDKAAPCKHAHAVLLPDGPTASARPLRLFQMRASRSHCRRIWLCSARKLLVSSAASGHHSAAKLLPRQSQSKAKGAPKPGAKARAPSPCRAEPPRQAAATRFHAAITDPKPVSVVRRAPRSGSGRDHPGDGKAKRPWRLRANYPPVREPLFQSQPGLFLDSSRPRATGFSQRSCIAQHLAVALDSVDTGDARLFPHA